MIMKGLVLLLLAVLAASQSVGQRPPANRRIPIVFPQRGFEESASSLGGAQVGSYSRTRGQPAFVRGRFPAFFPQFAGADEYGSSLGGAPVGSYNRDRRQRGRLVPARIPLFPQPVDTEYAASLGGADVGLYRRNRDGGRGFGSDVMGASLGQAPVGLFGRE